MLPYSAQIGMTLLLCPGRILHLLVLLALVVICRIAIYNIQYTFKATRMHIKFPPNDPSETRLIMNAKLRLPRSSLGPGHDLRKAMVCV